MYGSSGNRCWVCLSGVVVDIVTGDSCYGRIGFVVGIIAWDLCWGRIGFGCWGFLLGSWCRSSLRIRAGVVLDLDAGDSAGVVLHMVAGDFCWDRDGDHRLGFVLGS